MLRATSAETAKLESWLWGRGDQRLCQTRQRARLLELSWQQRFRSFRTLEGAPTWRRGRNWFGRITAPDGETPSTRRWGTVPVEISGVSRWSLYTLCASHFVCGRWGIVRVTVDTILRDHLAQGPLSVTGYHQNSHSTISVVLIQHWQRSRGNALLAAPLSLVIQSRIGP